MFKKFLCFMIVIAVLLSFSAIISMADSENLYTYDFITLDEGFTVENGQLSFTYAGNTFNDFVSAASDKILPNTPYKVTFAINIISVTGEVGIRFADTNDSCQFGLQSFSKYYSTPTTREYTQTLVSAPNADECSGMFKSYIHTPAGTDVNCTISVTVEAYSSDYGISVSCNGQIINAQKQNDEMFLFLPSFADTSELSLCGNCTISSDTLSVNLTETAQNVNLDLLLGESVVPGKEYTISVTDTNGETLPPLKLFKADKISAIFVTSDKTVHELHISKSVEGKGQLVMFTAAGEQVNSKTDLKKIKGRGNTSWTGSGEKRPYNFNMDKKSELIKGAGSSKKWCLISDNCQGEWVHEGAIYANAAAYDMFENIGGAYPIAHEFVHLYINSEYRGIYLLTEKVEIGSERVDITESEYLVEDEESTTLVISPSMSNYPQQWNQLDTENAIYSADDELIKKGIQAYQYATNSELADKSGGFLLELDRGFHGEASWFITRRGIPYVVKEPEFATKEQLFMIAEYVQSYEDALFDNTGYNAEGKYYAEYIDLDSAVKKMLVDLATGQCDTYVGSCFFSCDITDNGLTKLVAGPAWDYDGSEYESHKLFYDSNPTKQMIRELFKHGDFSALFTEYSNGTFKTVWAEEMRIMEEYSELLENSYKLNTALWNRDGSNPKPADFNTLMEKVNYRFDTWYNKFFATSNMLGITLNKNGNTITASADGTCSSIKWKKLLNGSIIDLPYVSGNSFTPTEEGIYFCVAEGITEESLSLNQMYSNPVIIKNYSIDFSQNTFFFNSLSPTSGLCIVAEYNSDGHVINVIKKPFTSSETITITPDTGSVYKAFLWDDNLSPFCESISFSVK